MSSLVLPLLVSVCVYVADVAARAVNVVVLMLLLLQLQCCCFNFKLNVQQFTQFLFLERVI